MVRALASEKHCLSVPVHFLLRPKAPTMRGPVWVILMAFAASLPEPPTAPSSHDKTFWRSIVHSDYARPADTSITDLATELSHLLASPDPELRDEFAYAILTNWIYQKRLIQPADLRPLMRQWVTNLTDKVGSTEGDSVFSRSFSALMLSVVVARDNASPILEPAEFRELLGAALVYLRAERDVRGYDARKGWMHSAAHTADLLKFLARSRHLERVDQQRILIAVGEKLRDAPIVFAFGEDERFARALLSLATRPDFDLEGFRQWADKARPEPLTERPDLAVIRGNQNLKNLFAKLHVVLLSVQTPTPGVQSAGDTVRLVLKDLF